MVTEIFGITNMPEIDEISHRIRSSAIYKAPHQINEIPFDSGIFGSVIVGNFENQSISFFDNDLTIIADVTLYNRSELKIKLNLKKNRFNDLIILLAAYRKWGRRCVEHLNGDFAFAIWDEKRKEIFCARDHIGARPFYFTLVNDGFVFASELRFIKVVFKNQPEENFEFFLDTLLTNISDKKETSYKNIYRLPPAHHLVFRNGKIEIHKYWQPDCLSKIRYKDSNEYFRHFRQILIESVESRCMGISIIGSELSGGLDSSAITGIAADLSEKHNYKFSSFSNTLPEKHDEGLNDEKEYILKMLSWKPVSWHEVNSTDENIIEILANSVQIQGCYTQQRFHMFNNGVFKAANKEGVEVLFSGFGGDEMVSARTGYSWNDLINEKQWMQFSHALKYETSIFKAFIRGLKKVAGYYVSVKRKPGKTSGRFTPDLINRRFEHLALNSAFAKENALKERYFSKHEREKKFSLSLRQLQRLDHPHVPQRLEYSYTAAAQYGIQYRYPLLDIRLLQTWLSYPSWIKHQPGMDRFLFRQVIKDFVPEDIRLREDKSGSVIPYINQQFKKEGGIIFDYIKSCSEKKILYNVFDYSKFEDWYGALIKRDKNEINYLMPGAFYNYMMLMIYYHNHNSL